MKRIRTNIIITLCTAAVLCACSKERRIPVLNSNTAITLDVVGFGNSTGTDAANTKAYPYTTENLSRLKVECYFSDTHELYFSDIFTKTGSTWSTSETYYWPLGRELDFVFRTETEAMDHYNYDPASGVGSFDYEACVFEDQKDMMVCVALGRSPRNCTAGAVNVVMEHTLCAVRFKADETVPPQIIFNEVVVEDMYVKGICTFKGKLDADGIPGTEIDWKVSKLHKFDFVKNFSLGRIIDGMAGIDGLVVGNDINPGEYLDRNQVTLEDTFLLIPDQKLTQINVQFYAGMQSRKSIRVDFDLERSNCYIFTFKIVPNDIYVVNSQIVNWTSTDGISQDIH